MPTPAKILYDDLVASGPTQVTVGSPAYNLAEMNPSSFNIDLDFWNSSWATISAKPSASAPNWVSDAASAAAKATRGGWSNFNPPPILPATPPSPPPQGLQIDTKTLLLIGAALVAVMLLKD